jgi:hypothetical protein
MNFRTLLARRKVAGLCGTLLICLAIALAVDGMIAGGRKDPRLYEMLPGQSLNLTDPLPRGAERIEDLALRPSSPRIAVRMLETFSGFWLGGVLWRAEAALPLDVPPGDYSVTMHYAQNGTETTPRQSYRLRVHKDAAAVQAASLSLVQRALGVSPYILAGCMLALALLPMLACLALSRNIARALRAEGMTEVYRAMASPEGQRIFFSQVSEAPPAADSLVEVLDERAEKVLGRAVVFAASHGNVEAIMLAGVKIRPGVLAKPL